MADPPPCDPTLGFDWRLVRGFLAVLDAGSVSAAARQLGAQQSTLSRYLAELETQLGAALFERTGRGVAPTAAAHAIEPAARRMQAAAESLNGALAVRRQRASGSVRISASSVAAAHVLPTILAALREAEPGIAIDLLASDRIANLLRREADIAVRMVRPAQASLVARKAGSVGVGVYAHERYLRRAGTPMQPADLLDHALIGQIGNPTIERGFQAAGLPLGPAAFALRTDDPIVYGQLVAAGAGIGFVAHFQAAAWPGMRRVLPQLRIASLPCWLAVHREIRGDAVVRRVYDFLAAALPARLAGFEA